MISSHYNDTFSYIKQISIEEHVFKHDCVKEVVLTEINETIRRVRLLYAWYMYAIHLLILLLVICV